MTARRRYRRLSDGTRRLVVLEDGLEGFIVHWTQYCTGCTEAGEYGGALSDYSYDSRAQCHVGAGCEECGYTGKRRWSAWIPFSIAS